MIRFKRLTREQSAQGLVEYILIIAVVALVAVAVVRGFGGRITKWFEKTGEQLEQGMGLDESN